METLEFDFFEPTTSPAVVSRAGAVLVGVVSSGNLEVLLEHAALRGTSHVQIVTSAKGYAPIWQAVLTDFFARFPLRDVRVSINDAGATPAVVSLRLDQAAADFQQGRP
jgi:malonate decarboxylase delta subunit